MADLEGRMKHAEEAFLGAKRRYEVAAARTLPLTRAILAADIAERPSHGIFLRLHLAQRRAWELRRRFLEARHDLRRTRETWANWCQGIIG